MSESRWQAWRSRRRQFQAAFDLAPPPQLGPEERDHIDGFPLASSMADFEFRLSCTVIWQTIPNTQRYKQNLRRSMAVNAVLQRSHPLTSTALLTHRDASQARLAAELAVSVPDQTGSLQVSAEDVRLDASDAEVAAVAKYQELRRNLQMLEREREWERSQREYLHHDVLSSTASAVVWWLVRHPDQVEDTARLIGPLALLAAVANDTEVPAQYLRFLPGSERPKSSIRP